MPTPRTPNREENSRSRRPSNVHLFFPPPSTTRDQGTNQQDKLTVLPYVERFGHCCGPGAGRLWLTVVQPGVLPRRSPTLPNESPR
jgi:hypothetical protein